MHKLLGTGPRKLPLGLFQGGWVEDLKRNSSHSLDFLSIPDSCTSHTKGPFLYITVISPQPRPALNSEKQGLCHPSVQCL